MTLFPMYVLYSGVDEINFASCLVEDKIVVPIIKVCYTFRKSLSLSGSESKAEPLPPHPPVVNTAVSIKQGQPNSQDQEMDTIGPVMLNNAENMKNIRVIALILTIKMTVRELTKANPQNTSI